MMQGIDSEATYKEVRNESQTPTLNRATDNPSTYKKSGNGLPKLPINQILCGDCLEIMKSFPERSINLVFLDPPYNDMRELTKHGETTKTRAVFTDIYIAWINKILVEVKRLLVLDGNIVFCGQPPFLNYLVVKALENLFVLTDWVTWHKVDGITPSPSSFARNFEIFVVLSLPYIQRKFNVIKIKSKTTKYNPERNIGSIWEHPKITSHHKEDVGHPTQKPEKLVGYLVKALTNKNDVVLDPFVGSGTTCVASQKLGRKWIGIDINPEYVEMAKKRLRKESQKITNW